MLFLLVTGASPATHDSDNQHRAPESLSGNNWLKSLVSRLVWRKASLLSHLFDLRALLQEILSRMAHYWRTDCLAFERLLAPQGRSEPLVEMVGAMRCRGSLFMNRSPKSGIC